MHLYEVLDSSGQVLVLPSDLISPYARHVALINLTSSQRYCIDTVYSAASALFSADPNKSNGNVEDAPLLSSSPRNCGVNTDMGCLPISAHHPRCKLEAVYDVIMPAAAQVAASSSFSTAASDQGAASCGVFDCAIGDPRLRSDIEIVSAALAVVRPFQRYLPHLVLRLGSVRLLDSILQLCLWELSTQPKSSVANDVNSNKCTETTLPSTVSDSRSTAGARLILSPADTQKLLRLLSASTDSLSSDQIKSILEEQFDLHPVFRRRFLPFVLVLNNQNGPDGSIRDPLAVIDDLIAVRTQLHRVSYL